MKLLITFLCVLSFIALSFSQRIPEQHAFNRQRSKASAIIPSAEFKHIPKKQGHYTADDWRAVIDATWGEGLSTAKKLEIFDQAWNKIDAEFAAFQGLDVNWDSIRAVYRPEVEAGVSRGRFAAIMNYMNLALEDLHTYIIDTPLMFTPLEPGVPLLYLGGNAENTSHFGAALTPLPDSSLLVLKTVSNHPLGLIPGDIVLGYDGILWKDLIKELMSFQLPIFLGWRFPTSDKISNSHNLLCGAGMNWHLFDTLDVVKYSTGDTMHFPTASLAGQNEFIWGNEQLPVPGVDWIYDGAANLIQDPLEFGDYISWGIVDNSNIGFIYAVSWLGEIHVPGSNVSQQFYDAIYNLMLVQNVDGLIIDQRINYGGLCEYQQGFSLLYNSTFRLFGIDKRCSSEDHYQMCPHTWLEDYLTLTTKGDPITFFDRPIAVLTGPVAASAGDLFALTIKTHPMARLFGKRTNGAFSSSSDEYNLGGNADWIMAHTSGNCYLLEDPGNYLARMGFIPDEEIWFTQEDVAKGEDTVVKRALEWIQNLAHAHDVTVNKTYVKPGTDSVLVTAQVENPNHHTLSVKAEMNNLDGVLIDSLYLYDDGKHSDGNAGDNLWGSHYVSLEEQSVTISIETKDVTNGNSRILPRIAWFTSIGPVLPTETAYIDTSYDELTNTQYLLLILHNSGSLKTAQNLSAKLNTEDPRVDKMVYGKRTIPDLPAGEIDTTTIFNFFSFTYENGFIPDCTLTKPIHFNLVVSSDGYPYWESSFDFVAQKLATSIFDDKNNVPIKITLFQNYPNPFNPVTTIEYQLPITNDVELSIYNLLGQKVKTLVSEKQPVGTYKVEWDGSAFASGIYLYKLKTDKGFSQSRKLILLK